MNASLQLALSMGVPTIAILVGILINNSRLGDMNSRLGDMNSRLTDMNARLAELRAHMDTRFNDMRDMWRAELHRVEEVLDARLKHLEER